jgi:hypothetical protein
MRLNIAANTNNDINIETIPSEFKSFSFDNGDGLTGDEIAGIAAGSTAAVVLTCVFCICCLDDCKKAANKALGRHTDSQFKLLPYNIEQVVIKTH